jgi:quinoprotein relay system zinc metallohydrolase 2
VALALALGAGWHADRAAGQTADFRLVEIAEGAYVHQGAHLEVDDPLRSDVANRGFIAGARCVAVIDTGGSVAAGAALRAALRRVTALPVCYVINTHVHFDHVLGNAAFSDDRPSFVGHRRLADAMAANREYFGTAFGAELGGLPPETAIIGPDRLVDGALVIDLGGRQLELQAHPPGHTEADLTVLDRASGILWLGDLLFLERTPALDGSLRGWLTTLDALRVRQFRAVVPGHGPAGAPWPQASDDLRRYLAALLDQTRAAVAAGVSMEEAMTTVGAEERDRWQLFGANHRRNVIRAYQELEWE